MKQSAGKDIFISLWIFPTQLKNVNKQKVNISFICQIIFVMLNVD